MQLPLVLKVEVCIDDIVVQRLVTIYLGCLAFG